MAHDPQAAADIIRAQAPGCSPQLALVLGTGIGDLQGQAFRIAHMGHVNAPMILGTLGVVEVALTALKIPHGKAGADAAILWLGENVKA